MRPRPHTLAVGLVLACLVPAALPATVAGATVTTRWVDDDGTIRENTIAGGQIGLNLLGAEAMQLYGNVSSGATVDGLYVAGQNAGQTDGSKTTAANIHGKDFTSTSNGGNADGKGETDYVVSVNTVTDNDVGSSDPVVMCDRGSVPG